MTYEVNTLNAISETLDGETIVINLKSGAYFSMNETGSRIWDSIVARRSMDSIVQSLLGSYTISKEDAEKAFVAFVTELQKNELVNEIPDTGDSPIEPAVAERKDFVAPHMNAYEDMREMLLADPIHDVAEVGWPTLKKE